MMNLFKTIIETIFTPASSLMVVNGEYYRPMATSKYDLNSPSINLDRYMLICDEQKR